MLWQELTEFLKGDLLHLFDEQGIDKTRYEHKVDFKVSGAGLGGSSYVAEIASTCQISCESHLL